jgi:4-amino-4-deoxy-L-arabinose transferase-like glycosyltransferase
MRRPPRLKTALLFAGTVVFAVLGQFYLFYRPDYVWDALLFLTIGLVCLVALRRRIGLHSIRRKALSRWRPHWKTLIRQPRAVLITLAVVVNWAAARSAGANPPPSSYTASVILWLGSLALLFGAFAPRRLARAATRLLSRSPDRAWRVRSAASSERLLPVRRFAARHGIDLALIAALVLGGLLLRAVDLAHIPINFSGDEGTQGMWAVDVLNGRVRNPFSTGWFTVPTMSFFAQAAALRIFGDNVAGLRFLSALIGTGTLAFTYLLARRILNRRIALLGVAALAFNHYHLHFSRLASNQIADPLFMTLTLWLLIEGLRRSTAAAAQSPAQGTGAARRDPAPTSEPAYGWFLGAGVAMGLSWYGYFGSRVILLVVAAYLGIQTVIERGFWGRHRRELALMLLTALMVASPLFLHYVTHPGNFSARFNQVSFFKWLDAELQRPGHDSAFVLVVRQIWRSFSAFNHTLDPTFWYRAQIPLLDFVSGILFILGLVLAINRWRRAGVRLVLLWFALAIAFGWVLTENPPSSMRMVIVAPAVAILVGIGLDGLLVLAHRVLRGTRRRWNQVGVAILAIIAVLNVHYYFVRYTPSRVYGNPTAETATVLARHLREWAQPAQRTGQSGVDAPFVYFYGPPFMYYGFGTIQFIARDIPGMDVPPRDQDPDFYPLVTGPSLFVVLRERLDELDAIESLYPNGKLQQFVSPADGRLMFVTYAVSR